MAKRPVLQAFFNFLSDIEALYPMLAKVNQRGKIDVRIRFRRELLRREPRLRHAFKAHGLKPRHVTSFGSKFLFHAAVNAADACMALQDPANDVSKWRRCSKYIQTSGRPTIVLQHGAYQVGINAIAVGKERNSFYAQKLLLWEPLNENEALFGPEDLAKVEIVGFQKKNILPAYTPHPDCAAWARAYPKRLVICHSFRWPGERFSDASIKRFYALLDSFLEKHKDVGIILRAHRGEMHDNHIDFDKKLVAKHKNILLSHEKTGPLANTTIHDVLDMCHGMISPPSTTVLDAAYAGKAVAVFDEDVNTFPEVPIVSDLSSMEAFVDTLHRQNATRQALITRFGDIDTNIERAALATETYLLNMKSQQAA